MKNKKNKIELRFGKTPIHKNMSTRSLKLLMIKLRAKNFLCFPRLDDKSIKIKNIKEVYVLNPKEVYNSLTLHGVKGLRGWSVWHEPDKHILGVW